MKDDFIATASHELRTPLTGVQGFLDLLLDYAGSRDEPLALEFLRKATDSAQELAEIAERLLQTSRLDTGRVELHTTPVRLAPVVEGVVRSFAGLQAAQGTAHALVAEVPPEVYVRADLGRLKEVLDNLVGNAIKYSPQGGRISVRCLPSAFGEAALSALAEAKTPQSVVALAPDAIAEHPTIVLAPLTPGGAEAHREAQREVDDHVSTPAPAVVAAAAAQPYYSILVSDEGMGIALDERAHLFGRFSRTDSARISQIRGTGLGLYICRQIARAMGGDVWLEASAPGHGSTFALALPYAPTPGSADDEIGAVLAQRPTDTADR